MTVCLRHSDEETRVALDDELRNLPFSQAGEGRHKCAYCAFEEGRTQGRDEARQEFIEKISDFIRGHFSS